MFTKIAWIYNLDQGISGTTHKYATYNMCSPHVEIHKICKLKYDVFASNKTFLAKKIYNIKASTYLLTINWDSKLVVVFGVHKFVGVSPRNSKIFQEILSIQKGKSSLLTAA